MKLIRHISAIITLSVVVPVSLVTPGFGGEDCRPVEERPVKIEAWISKKDMKHYRALRRDMEAMGTTHATFWPYPGKNPSRIVAIGRCVPAYIARHALQQALIYFGDVKSLVNQSFISGHWIGLGTSLFAENSQQPISPEQLRALLDPDLDTFQFQALYRKLTVQDPEVSAFGQKLPNPKLMK
ncbi:MAG: hypothetical protein GWM98_25195 [Nitrospinaceae bacterium]|nr:hypothetical protein [Nitrospinaceae bacterium]NIR57163.1 hypothetical protein [Nitrospinaceae bacterium]NIS87605.1 hypothetical protein [Nitrospinaceae bacterium]NIT84476.1 hypothetical protein [Nitrospinaceae bacterium]NIU46662.1 hypothetical protein [Nitrospinaceae bacterium]